MNIMSLGVFDPAGLQTTYAKAWNKYGYGSWRTYFLNNYMRLQTDLTPLDDMEKIFNVIKETDIFIINVVIDNGEIDTHLINDWDILAVNNKDIGIIPIMNFIKEQNKPIIFFINGSSNVRKWNMFYQNIFKQITDNIMVSTPDLLTFFPDAEYIPGFIPLDDDFWNLPKYETKELWIGHFPTNPDIKNTREFLDVIKELQHYDIKVDVINRISFKQAINYKRDMDITFDHMQGYYGLNSLESSALGVINLVKLDKDVKEIFCERAGTQTVPWDLIEKKDDIKERILYYFNNRDEMKKRQKDARLWMEKYWYPKKHLDYINNIFKKLKK